MGVIEWVLLAVLGLFVACLQKLLTDELKAWLPSLIEMILSFAVRGVPASLRDRYAEEWRAHLNELPGDLTKLFVAFGFVWAKRKMNDGGGQQGAESGEASADSSLTSAIVRGLAPEPSDSSLTFDGFTELRRRGLLLSLTVSLSLGLVASTIYVPSIPAIAHGLHTSIGRVQFTFVGYLLAFAASMLIVGPLSDRFGRKRMLICGLVLAALSSLGCAAAPTIEVLIAARVLQGIGACAAMVIGRAATRDIWRPEAAAQVIAGRVIVSTLMQAFAPVLGGYLQVWFGWRANFLVVMALSCFAIALVIRYLPDGNRGQRPSLERQRMLASYRALILTRRFIGYAFSGAGAHAGFHIFAAGAPAVLIGKFGLTPEQYGYYAALPPLGFIVGSFISQRLTGRLGIDRAITVGMMILVPAGLIMVALALAHISFPFSVVGPVIFVCCGSGLITSNAAVGSLGTNPLNVGAASGLGSFIQMTGAASATAALTLGPSGSQLVLALIIAFAGLFCVMSFGALMRSPPAPAEVKGALADAGVSSGAASPS